MASALAAPRPPSFNEEDVSDKPSLIRNLALGPKQLASIDQFYRGGQESLMAVDELVDSVVTTLQEQGVLANTYVFYTSDNGFMLGHHRVQADKDLHYEESIRVPLFVRGPGVPAGVVLDQMVLNLDLAPTFADLAEAAVPDFVDGRSLVPLLLGAAAPSSVWRQAFVVEHWPWRGRPGVPVLHVDGVRTADYLYTEWSTGERELYDFRADPFQLDNLLGADGAGTHPEVARLSGWLRVLRTCAGAACRSLEAAPPQ